MDIEATARELAAIDGVGPFFRTEFPLYDLVYRGGPVDYGILRVAFAYQGEQQDALVTRYAAAGETMAYSGLAGDRVRFGFIDATAPLGHFIEVLHTHAVSSSEAALFACHGRTKLAARVWNGERPVRSLQELIDT